MTQETTDLLEHALQLPIGERELLAVELMSHLHEHSESFASIETAWQVEIDRRAAASESGDGGAASFHEAWPRIVGNNG